MNYFKYLIGFAFTFFFISTFAYSQDDRGYIVQVGQTAPDFTTITTDGKKFNLLENRGKIVMLQFTASWCGVCRKEMTHIEKDE